MRMITRRASTWNSFCKLEISLEILIFWLGFSYSGWLRENKKAALFTVGIRLTSFCVPGEFFNSIKC